MGISPFCTIVIKRMAVKKFCLLMAAEVVESPQICKWGGIRNTFKQDWVIA